MLGTIIGDIAGSIYERHNIKTKEFEFFNRRCHFTDDTVMTLAVAKAILNCKGDYSGLYRQTISCMQALGNKYPRAGYGRGFRMWLKSEDPQPYYSYGNGSAMRSSPCGYAAKTLEEALMLAEITAKVTHDHPEGIKGAQAVAAAVFLARNGKKIPEISEYINTDFYQINFTIDEIRPTYSFSSSCQGSVPQALQAFFESSDFEDAVRNAISIGGDSDTIAAIAGSIAEAYYGIPDDIKRNAFKYLDNTLIEIYNAFEAEISDKT